MYKIFFVFLCAAFLADVNLFAQQNPKLPVSPEASSLMKMVNYPVNLNTGLPDISIPLYTIESGNLSLPINLNYHSGGFKIHEKATSIGLGWSHSADLQITRSVNGLDDFSVNGYILNPLTKVYNSCSTCAYPFYVPNLLPFQAYNTYQLAAGEKDGMPDKFTYKLLGKSGTFYFRKNGPGTGATIVTLPYEDIKITYTSGQFKVVDTDGTIYYFGEQGAVHESNVAAMGLELSNDVRTAWKCVSIQNATQTESLTFTYVAKSKLSFRSNTPYVEFYTTADPCALDFYYRSDQIAVVNPWITTYEGLMSVYPLYSLSCPKYMEKFANGTSLFHLPDLNSLNQPVDKTYSVMGSSGIVEVFGIALSRIDFNGGAVVFNGTDQLNSIRIQNAANAEIKTFTFNQSVTAPMHLSAAQQANGTSFTGTRYLDSVQVRKNNLVGETYRVLYNNKFCFGSHLQGSDAWGYPNMYTAESATQGNFSSMPLQNIVQRFYKDINGGCSNFVNATFSFGTFLNKEMTDDSPARLGMLKRIIYPTGGYVDFDFESNMYEQKANDFLDRVGMSGGVRIKSITTYDGVGLKPRSQKYYRYGEYENGIGKLINSPSKNYSLQMKNFDAFSYDQTTSYLTGPGSANFGSNFVPIPQGCNNRGCLFLRYSEKKTTYMPASASDYNYPNGSPIYYNKVTEYNQDFGKMTGKTVYTFYEPNDFGAYFTPYNVKIEGTNIDMLQTEGLMGMQKSTEEYKYEKGKFFLHHDKRFTYTKRSQSDQIRVAYAFFKIVYEVVGGGFSGNQLDLYNTDQYLPSSTGVIQEPFGYGEYGIQVAKLLPDTVTERWVTTTGTISELTDYDYESLNYSQPTKISYRTSKGTETRFVKYSYDFPGTPIYDQMTAKNMISQVVEEVVTNGAAELSKTKTNYAWFNNNSFISTASVQGSVSGSPLDTLIKYDKYSDKGNVLQITEKGKLIKSYIWGYNNKYPVAEVNGSNYQNATAGVNVAALNALSDDSQITTITNGVRSALSNAMVTTFTYKPLVGTSSITGPNGNSKFYEYDPYGRLDVIKDQKFNILKKFDYNIPQSTSAFANNLGYVNIPQMLTFNKICVIDTIQVNAIQPGGAYIYGYPLQADLDGLNNLLSNYSSLIAYEDCSALATVTIDLENNVQSAPPYISPTYVYVDFIKDNSICASMKFPNNLQPNTKIKIEAGNYKIAVRFDENYNGSLTRVSVIPSTGGYAKIASGDALSCLPGVTYKFTLSNGN